MQVSSYQSAKAVVLCLRFRLPEARHVSPDAKRPVMPRNSHGAAPARSSCAPAVASRGAAAQSPSAAAGGRAVAQLTVGLVLQQKDAEVAVSQRRADTDVDGLLANGFKHVGCLLIEHSFSQPRLMG